MSVKYHRYKKWGSMVIDVPHKMQHTTKSGEIKVEVPITKSGAIATRKGEKAVKLNPVKEKKEEPPTEKEEQTIEKEEPTIEKVDPRIEKIISKLERLKKNVDQNGQNMIDKYINKFKTEKTMFEYAEVILEKFKRAIDTGKWSIKYGNKVNTGILDPKNRHTVAIFNQMADQVNKKVLNKK